MKKIFVLIFALSIFLITSNALAASVYINPICNGLTCDFTVNVTGITEPIGINLNYEGVDFIYSNQNIPAVQSYTYSNAGTYNVKAIIYKDGANVATGNVNVTVPLTLPLTLPSSGRSTNTGTIDIVTDTNLKTDVLDKLPLGTSKGPDTINKVIDIFLDIVNWIFVIATGIGVLMIIVSGISYMFTGGDSAKSRKATKTLLYASIGVAIALTSSFIIQIIKNLLISP